MSTAGPSKAAGLRSASGGSAAARAASVGVHVYAPSGTKM